MNRIAWILVAALVALLSGGLGLWWGARHPDVRLDKVRCLSAQDSISCQQDGDWTYSIPTDVTWTDARGTRGQGRPGCLPPKGRGLSEPVTIAWVPVDVDGMAWRQVVWVGC